MLLQAAAEQWNVPATELTVSDGVITHGASKRSIRYGEVAASAAKTHAAGFPIHQAQGSEGLEDRRQAAQTARHADKLNGSKVFAIDLKLPGMLNAAIKDCPVYGGKLRVTTRAESPACPASRSGAGQGHRRSRRRRYLVAGQEGARRAAGRLG